MPVHFTLKQIFNASVVVTCTAARSALWENLLKKSWRSLAALRGCVPAICPRIKYQLTGECIFSTDAQYSNSLNPGAISSRDSSYVRPPNDFTLKETKACRLTDRNAAGQARRLKNVSGRNLDRIVSKGEKKRGY